MRQAKRTNLVSTSKWWGWGANGLPVTPQLKNPCGRKLNLLQHTASKISQKEKAMLPSPR
jgi:hypothetical protein